MIWGVGEALWKSPPDAYQGEWIRMLYIHVPCSWMALALYAVLGTLSGVFIIYKAPMARWIAQACGWVGLCFGVLSLITGMLWAKPTWGTWWVWDARLTSMVLLVMLYGGFVTLEKRALSSHTPGPGSILGVLGLVNLPIIKWSVTWWATLHQPSSVQWNFQSTLDPAFLRPLWIMGGGMISYTCFLVYGLTLDRMRITQKMTQDFQQRHTLKAL